MWLGAVSLLLAAPLAAQAPPPPPPRLYVTNQDDATVTIVDATTHAAIETLDLRRLGFGDNAKPHHAQVEPDGSAWYLTLIGAGRVLRLDRANRITDSVALEVPGLIALHPTRDLMFVARSMSAVNPPPRMAVIRRSTMELLDEIDLVFPRPHGVVVHPGGARVYVASLGVNQFASVGVEGGDVRLVDVPGPPRGFVQAAVSPDGRWLALTAELTDEVMLFDLADPAAPVPARSIPTPDGPFESVFTPDGKWLYVTCLAANRVAVVDVATWAVTQVLEHAAFGQPHGLAVSRDARFVFVSNRHQLGGAHAHEGGRPTGAGTLTAICVATRAVDHVLTVGRYAAGIGTTPPAPGTSPPPGPCR